MRSFAVFQPLTKIQKESKKQKKAEKSKVKRGFGY